MSIKFRDKKVGVEKLKKQTKKENRIYIEPESEEYLGVVRYVSDDASKDIKVGSKVYFGTDHQKVRMEGAEICVMEDASIYAIVDEEQQTQQP